MTKLFEKVLSENKKYVALVEADSTEQVAQLDVCRALMDEVVALGLFSEYRDYCDTLIAKNGRCF